MFEPVLKGTSETALASLETRLHITLPADYRSFLLEHNGGRPVPPSTCMVCDVNEAVLVDMLFGLDNGEPDLDIRTWTERYGPDEVPPGMLVIGVVGDLRFVLGVCSSRPGVYCWDRMGELGVEGTLYPIAATFQEFLASLRPAAILLGIL